MTCAAEQPFFRKFLWQQVKNLARASLRLEQNAPTGDTQAPPSLTAPSLLPARQALRDKPQLSEKINVENLEVIVQYLETLLEVTHDG